MADLFDKHDADLHQRHLEVLAAQSRRDDGIDASAEHAGDDWVQYAIRFLQQYLRSHSHMHVDDLWNAGLEKSASDRGLGQVIRYAAKHGWMEQVKLPNGWVAAKPSVRSNMQLKAVWKSRL